MNAGAREVNAAARRFVAIEARKASRRRIRVNKSCGVNKCIVAEPAETLQESPIDWPNFPISANTEVVRSRARVTEKLKLVSPDVISTKKRPAVTLRRVTHSEPDFFVLG